MRQLYDGNELRQKTDLLLMSSGFPIDVDICHNLIAFVYTEINEESMVSSLLKSLEQSSLGKNMYLKEAASKLVQMGHSSMDTIGNLLNVNKVANIEDIPVRKALILSKGNNSKNFHPLGARQR